MRNFLSKLFGDRAPEYSIIETGGNAIIKSKFKCGVCERTYPIRVDMIRDVYNQPAFGGRQYAKAFNCPVCKTIYCNWGGSDWIHESWDFIDANK